MLSSWRGFVKCIIPTTLDTLTDTSTHVNICCVREIATLDPACCVVGEAPLGKRDAERLADALRVLADPARLRLVSLIAAEGEVCQCDLTRPLGLSQPTISHHLGVLTDAGVLEREKRGRWAFYRVRREPLTSLAGALGG